MNGSSDKPIHRPTIPSRHLGSTAFAMKAVYQRNMLLGLLVGSLLVILPVLAWAYWIPAPNSDGSTSIAQLFADSVFIEVNLDQGYTIIPEQKPVIGPSGGARTEGAVGTFVDRVILIPEGSEAFHEYESFGVAGTGLDFGPGDPLAPPTGGFGSFYVADTSTYAIGTDLDQLPEMVVRPQPDYPPLARTLGEEGRVLLHVLVGPDGSVLDVRVAAESTAGFGFSEYAARAAWRASFSPAIHNSQPVRCWVAFPVEFRMER